jgi:hypothetical protein
MRFWPRYFGTRPTGILKENYTGILLYALKDGASTAFAKRLHPQSQNVYRCIEISAHGQAPKHAFDTQAYHYRQICKAQVAFEDSNLRFCRFEPVAIRANH